MSESIHQPQIESVISKDGLEMTLSWLSLNGTRIESTVRWGDLATAQAYYDVARQRFAEDIASKLHLQPGERRWSRAFRRGRYTLYLQVNTGPPTWWLPRFGIKLTERCIRGGWLKAAIIASLRRSSSPVPAETSTEEISNDAQHR